MRFLTTRGYAPAVSFKTALFEGLAPDGGLYVPASIPAWTLDEITRLPCCSLADIAVRTLMPFAGDEINEPALREVTRASLDFPIPLVEVDPGVHALELFHGPTLAFKDVGARMMARLMAALHDGGDPLTVLVATSGDTGSAVAHAFAGVPHTRVVILYPDGRVSPTQEAQLTTFNDPEPGGATDQTAIEGNAVTNVRSYAIAGSFDDCQRLVKEAFTDRDLRCRLRLTSANSINIGRLLPQMIYYFHALARLEGLVGQVGRVGQLGQVGQRDRSGGLMISTPSGNFGNLTAGLMARHAGLPVDRFVAATNVNDVVPAYLSSGRFEPRPSIPTVANAMDVGNPSNFDRMSWMYGGQIEAMRRVLVGSRHDDEEVRLAIRRVYDRRGYLLDPHSAIAYLGLIQSLEASRRAESGAHAGVFLATAHPAKFAEIVEPIVGRPIDRPAPLAAALSRRHRIVRIDASPGAVREVLVGSLPRPAKG